MSKVFKVKVKDNRPEADEFKNAWEKGGRNTDGSTIFHEYAVTEVASMHEAIDDVSKIIDSANMRIISVEEIDG